MTFSGLSRAAFCARALISVLCRADDGGGGAVVVVNDAVRVYWIHT